MDWTEFVFLFRTFYDDEMNIIRQHYREFNGNFVDFILRHIQEENPTRVLEEYVDALLDMGSEWIDLDHESLIEVVNVLLRRGAVFPQRRLWARRYAVGSVAASIYDEVFDYRVRALFIDTYGCQPDVLPGLDTAAHWWSLCGKPIEEIDPVLPYDVKRLSYLKYLSSYLTNFYTDREESSPLWFEFP
jgi:hypothetical protein